MKGNTLFKFISSHSVLCAILCVAVVLLSGCSDTEDRKSKYFNRGMALYEQGNYTKARLEFKNVLQIDPKDAEGYFMFASIEEKEQNWRKAYALFLRATELAPKHVDALVHLGRLYALSGSSEKALESAEKALAIKPDDTSALVLKGLAEARMGNKVEAISVVEKAVNKAPDNVDGLTLLASLYADQGLAEKAIELAQNGLVSNPSSVGIHLLLAKFYEKAGNTEKTTEFLKKIIDLKPEDLQRRNHLAGYYHSKKLFDKAEQMLRETIQLFPKETNAKLTLAKYLRQKGEKDKSEKVLTEFIAQAPEDYDLQIGLASFLVDAGKKMDAMSILDRVVDHAGEGVSARKARTKKAALLISEKDFDQASKQVAVVLDENSKDPEALLIRAGISLATSDADRGIADLRTLLKEEPGNVRALRLKARAHMMKNEAALAKQSLELAVEAEPQEVNANVELVRLLIQSGDSDAAVDVLVKMLRFVPNDQSILLAMAKIRVQQKKWKEVDVLANQMVEMSPDLALGYYYKGLVLQADKQFQQSIAAFEESLKRKPNAAEPLISLAQSLLSIGKVEEAQSRVDKVINATPSNYLALNLKGEIYLTEKQISKAKVAFERAIEVKPEWSPPYRNLAKIALFNHNDQLARSYLKKGFEATNDPALGVEYAQFQQKAGDNAAARKIYETVLEKNPRLVAARNNYAMLLTRGQPNREDLDLALDMVTPFELSDNPILLDSLGWVYFKRRELGNAIKTLERAHGLLKEGQVPEISYHLAEVYVAMERKPEGIKLLELVVASNGQFEGVERAKTLLAELQ